jgi:membrane-associated phospholipid phosphatase
MVMAAQQPVVPIVDGHRPADVEAVSADAAPSAATPAVEPAAPVEPSVPVAAPTPPTPTPAPAPTSVDDDLGFVHHLKWYGAEYAAVAVVGGLYLAGVHENIAPNTPLIGPAFDLNTPDLDLLLDPRLDDVIGKPMLQEKVPTSTLTVGLATTIVGMGVVDALVAGDAHHTHNVVLGGVESLLGTVLVIEVMKPLFGRLRPDFRDRYLHAACAGTADLEVPLSLDCSGVDNSVVVDAAELRDGQKSFASGHAASSFAVATFGSWWLANTLVLGDNVPSWGPAVGALGIGTLMSTAGFVAATRVADNRHHIEDVVVGAGVGVGVASAIWFTHFDGHGRARKRSFSVAPAVGMGSSGTGTGIALVGNLP